MDSPPKKAIKGLYKQAFIKKWLNDNNLKEWLIEDPSDKGYSSYCVYCQAKMKNYNKSMLYKHSKTVKHINNMKKAGSATKLEMIHKTPKPIKYKFFLESEELQGYLEDAEEIGQDHYSIAEETSLDNSFLLLDNGSLQPLKTLPAVGKRTPKKEPKRIPIQNQKEPASKKTKIYKMVGHNQTQISQQLNAFQPLSDEFESFGNTVAAHIRSLSTTNALESQADILQYLVQKRLGRRPMFVTNPEYIEAPLTNSI